MANEVQISVSLAFNLPGQTTSPVGRSLDGFLSNSLLGLGPVGQTVSIPTGGVAIDMGGITSPGYAWFRNLDPVNYVQIWSSVASQVNGDPPMLNLPPGAPSLCCLDPTAAPYAVANTAAILLEFLICSR